MDAERRKEILELCSSYAVAHLSRDAISKAIDLTEKAVREEFTNPSAVCPIVKNCGWIKSSVNWAERFEELKSDWKAKIEKALPCEAPKRIDRCDVIFEGKYPREKWCPNCRKRKEILEGI